MTSGTGTFGSTESGYGVEGVASANTAAGVYGYGVYGGVTDAGIGTYGKSPGGYGLEGVSNNLPLMLTNDAAPRSSTSRRAGTSSSAET